MFFSMYNRSNTSKIEFLEKKLLPLKCEYEGFYLNFIRPQTELLTTCKIIIPLTSCTRVYNFFITFMRLGNN